MKKEENLLKGLIVKIDWEGLSYLLAIGLFYFLLVFLFLVIP